MLFVLAPIPSTLLQAGLSPPLHSVPGGFSFCSRYSRSGQTFYVLSNVMALAILTPPVLFFFCFVVSSSYALASAAVIRRGSLLAFSSTFGFLPSFRFFFFQRPSGPPFPRQFSVLLTPRRTWPYVVYLSSVRCVAHLRLNVLCGGAFPPRTAPLVLNLVAFIRVFLAHPLAATPKLNTGPPLSPPPDGL